MTEAHYWLMGVSSKIKINCSYQQNQFYYKLLFLLRISVLLHITHNHPAQGKIQIKDKEIFGTWTPDFQFKSVSSLVSKQSP